MSKYDPDNPPDEIEWCYSAIAKAQTNTSVRGRVMAAPARSDAVYEMNGRIQYDKDVLKRLKRGSFAPYDEAEVLVLRPCDANAVEVLDNPEPYDRHMDRRIGHGNVWRTEIDFGDQVDDPSDFLHDDGEY